MYRRSTFPSWWSGAGGHCCHLGRLGLNLVEVGHCCQKDQVLGVERLLLHSKSLLHHTCWFVSNLGGYGLNTPPLELFVLLAAFALVHYRGHQAPSLVAPHPNAARRRCPRESFGELIALRAFLKAVIARDTSQGNIMHRNERIWSDFRSTTPRRRTVCLISSRRGTSRNQELRFREHA